MKYAIKIFYHEMTPNGPVFVKSKVVDRMGKEDLQFPYTTIKSAQATIEAIRRADRLKHSRNRTATIIKI